MRESEDKFQAFAQAVPHHVWSAYPDGRLEWVNARLYEYLGSDAIDPDSLRFDAAVHPDDFAVADPAWMRTVAAGTAYESEYRLRRFDGLYRWHLTRAVPIRNGNGEITRWIGTNTDIDENKAVAESLTTLNRSLERQVALRTADRDRLWQNSQDILVVTDAEGVYRAVSPAWTKVFGHDPAEVIGRSYINFIHPQDVPMVRATHEAGGLKQSFTGFVTRHIHKNGAPRWVSWSSTNEDGLIYATGRDITAVRFAETELARAQARIRTIFETTFQFQAYLSPDGILLDVNPAGLAMIAAERDDVIGRYFWDTAWFLDTPGIADNIQAGVAMARDGRTTQREIQIDLPPNGLRYWDISIRPVNDRQSVVTGIIFEAMDLTERRDAEQQLHQAQKMEAVGQLTGGLAHDFNNMLAIVISALKLLESRGGGLDDQSRRFIDAAKDAAFRASKLTRRLLDFSRQQPLVPVVVNISTIIISMVALLRHAIGDRIRLNTHLAEDLWPTYADTNQLENIVLNLVVNARDAMDGGGDLSISTSNVTILDEMRSAISPVSLSTGQYVTISVRDNGCGMPPDVEARAFEPFFTTKEPGKGTGLGLSQVYGFVKRFGGDVRIESELGIGTTITLYLRRVTPAEHFP